MALTGTEVLHFQGAQPNGVACAVQGQTTTQAIANLSVSNRGTVVLTGSSPVTVTYAGMTITKMISFSLNTVGGTVGAIPVLKTLTAGVGFTVAGTASDTSTYNWIAE